jgi:hypothetical protein
MASRWPAVVIALAALAACSGETPVGTASGAAAEIAASRAIDLSACPTIAVPPGSKLVSRVYASGAQIYRWTGTSWSFVAPDAVLTSDAGGRGVVGTHYAGPTWESNSGGTVVGSVLERCTPDASAVPWLLLSAVADGPGIFHRVKFIQRVNTTGGLAPAASGSVVGQEARVPYTTEYLFYR